MTSCCPTRRSLLITAGSLTAWAFLPKLASAAGAPDPRFLTIILRGALDGLGAVAPGFDPDYARMRAGLLIGAEDGPSGLPLSDGFLLNPRMPRLHALYGRGEALIVHAVATPYRERSHFDGQDVLESGRLKAGETRDGWLNRALAALPKGERAQAAPGLAVGAQIPLVMRGAAEVSSWLPAGYPQASADTRARLLDLYQHTQPRLASLFAEGLALEKRSQGMFETNGTRGNDAFLASMRAVGEMMAAEDGFRIGALDLDGWDTHAGERPVSGRLGGLLETLDQGIDALRNALGPAWRQTVVALVTEFGRTVPMNGTAGTDHGTGTVAFLVGGAVKGGRVVADWPGLSQAALHEGRDLRPTTDLRAVLKGALRDHLGLAPETLGRHVFPDSATVRPLDGLIV